jgi:hypothetical protein
MSGAGTNYLTPDLPTQKDTGSAWAGLEAVYRCHKEKEGEHLTLALLSLYAGKAAGHPGINIINRERAKMGPKAYPQFDNKTSC